MCAVVTTTGSTAPADVQVPRADSKRKFMHVSLKIWNLR